MNAKQKEKEEAEALEQQQLAVQKADKALAAINFRLQFHIKSVKVELTGNKSDAYGNSKLLSFGFQEQGFTVKKHRDQIEVNVLGVTLGVYNTFEEVYKFAMRSQNTMLQVKDHVESSLKDDEYVQELKAAVEASRSVNNSSQHINMDSSPLMDKQGGEHYVNAREMRHLANNH